MKRILLFTMMWVSVCAARGEGEMTMKECIRLAIERNLGLKNAELGISASRAAVSQSRARLLPTLGLGASVQDYLKKPANVTTATLLGMDFSDDPTWNKVTSMKYTTQAGLSLALPLYDQTIMAAVKAQQTVEELSRVGRDKARLDLAVQTAHVYCMAQMSLEQTYLMHENIERMNELCDITQALYEQGVVLEIDYTRVDINRKNLTTQLDQQRMLYNQQLNILRFLMDMEPETPLDVVRMPVELVKYPIQEFNTSLPDIVMTDKKIELTERQIKAVKAGYLPRLSLGGTAGYIGYQEHLRNAWQGAKSNWFGHTSLTLNLTMPLFDANQKKLKIRQYRFEAEQARNSRQQQENKLRSDYDNLRLQISHNERMFATQSSNYQQSRDVYDVTNTKYKEGVASMTELLQDDMRLREAQSALVLAHYQFNTALVDLLHLCGDLDNYIER